MWHRFDMYIEILCIHMRSHAQIFDIKCLESSCHSVWLISVSAAGMLDYETLYGGHAWNLCFFSIKWSHIKSKTPCHLVGVTPSKRISWERCELKEASITFQTFPDIWSVLSVKLGAQTVTKGSVHTTRIPWINCTSRGRDRDIFLINDESTYQPQAFQKWIPNSIMNIEIELATNMGKLVSPSSHTLHTPLPKKAKPTQGARFQVLFWFRSGGFKYVFSLHPTKLEKMKQFSQI